MSAHVSIERMHEAIDGLLASAEVSAIESHLSKCAACRNDHARLSEVVGAVRALPRSAASPPDAWAVIAERIAESEQATPFMEAKVLRLPTPSRGSGTQDGGGTDDLGRRRLTLSMPQLFVAASIVAFAAAATTWLALDNPVGVADSGVEAPGGAAARAVSLEVDRYVDVVDELERILEGGRAVLGPETLMTIEESLRTVDAAIAEVELALGEDPNSDLLLRMLASQQRTKLGVLQRAAAAVQAQT